MPTTRPRHVVTESDELAEALDEAARRWPELSRGQLVVRLALEAHRTAEATRRHRSQRRRQALARHGGACTGCYGPGDLQALRDEWPG